METIVATMIGAVIGSLASLGGILLQSYLESSRMSDHSLREARRAVFSRLLFAVMSEETYPSVPNTLLGDTEITKHNEKLNLWRKGRRELKGIASEALLLTSSEELKNRLKEFIGTKNPSISLVGIEKLMRQEIIDK